MVSRRTISKVIAGAFLFPASLGHVLSTSAFAENNDENERLFQSFQKLAAEFESDRRIWIFDESVGERSRHRIVGDIVYLSRENFPSLFRDNGQTISDNQDLIIEARVIIVDMALRFTTGQLTMRASIVQFGYGGLISFAAAPGEYAQSIDIVTRGLSFRGGRRYPFPFRLGLHNRSLSISAEVTRAQNGSEINYEKQYLSALALNLSSKDISGRPQPARGGAVVFQTGASALNRYVEASQSAVWLDAFALKLQRFFARSPYDPDRIDYVNRFANSALARFQGRNSGSAIGLLNKLIACSNAGTDLYGLRHNQVPMTSLTKRIDRFNRLIGELFGGGGQRGLLELWDGVAAASSNAGGFDPELFGNVSKRLETKRKQLDALILKVAELEANLADVESSVTVKNDEIFARDTYLRQLQVAEASDGADLSTVAAGVKVIAAVGSVVFPAAAPLLMVASGAVSAAAAAQKNNGDVVATITDIQGIVLHHRDMLANTQAIRNDWSTLTKQYKYARKYVTDNDKMSKDDHTKFQEWKSSVANLKSNTQTLYETLSKKPETAELKIDEERIRHDPQMVSFVEERNSQVRQQSALTGELVALRHDFTQKANSAIELEAVVADMQKLVLQNDAALRNKRKMADIVRREVTADIDREAHLLIRSLNYTTGEKFQASEDLLPIPEGELDRLERDGLTDAEAVESSLLRNRVEREASYRLLLQRVRNEADSLQEQRRWNVASPIAFSARLNGNSGDARARADRSTFVSDLNRTVADAIRSGGKSGSIAIPFRPAVVSTTENAVLFGINISKLAFTPGREPETSFTMIIEHPRYGILHRNRVSMAFQDYAGEGAEISVNPAEFPISLPETSGKDWKENLSLDDQLFSLRETMLPFFTNYRARIAVPVPENWSSAPEISEIEIQFIAIKPA